MTISLDLNRPVFDQDGRKVDIMSVCITPVEFPITAMVRDRKGARTPLAFDRAGKSRRGPSHYLTN